MSAPPRPPAPPGPAKASVPVGARARVPGGVDLDEVTRRVYQLMLDDLRLDRARQTGER